MVWLRVWVSYAAGDEFPQEAMLVQQLISDLQNAGAEVVTDNAALSDEQFTPFFRRELSTCAWFLLVQTQEITGSFRVQEAMNIALQQVERGQLRGVIRIICPSWDAWNEPAQWSETKSYSFQGDYPRLRDKILLDLDLLRIEDVVEKSIRDAVTIMLPPGPKAADLEPFAAKKEVVPPGPKTVDQNHYPIKRETVPFFLNRREKLRKLLAHGRKKSMVPPLHRQEVAYGDRPAAPPRLSIYSGRLIRYGIVGCCGLALLLSVSLLLLRPFSRPIGPRPAPSPTMSSPTTRPVAHVLAQDTFQRPNQVFWGVASDGQDWGSDANRLAAFSIVNHTGQIAAQAAGMYSAVIGPAVGNADVTLSATVNQFAGSINLVNLGVVLRWQDPNNWYKVLIDGNNLSIDRHVNGNAAVLASVPFPAQGGGVYTLRFRAVGTTLLAKAWPSNETEPPNWMITVTDSSFASGQGGVRVLLQNTTQINVMSFKETAV